mgnify:CR=1 FL=1
MKPATQASALKVQVVLGPRFRVVEFEESTRTSADAAAAIGCTVAQIAKSVIFRAAESGRPVLVVASGVSYFINDFMAKAKYGNSDKMNYEQPLTTLVWLTSIVSVVLTYIVSYLMIPELGGDSSLWWKLSTVIPELFFRYVSRLFPTPGRLIA